MLATKLDSVLKVRALAYRTAPNLQLMRYIGYESEAMNLTARGGYLFLMCDIFLL